MILRFLFQLVLLLILSVGELHGAPATGGGRGGPFIDYHSRSVTTFDGLISGQPVALGGVGFVSVARNFRVGGGGGGVFLSSSSENAQFSMGYGGIIGEFVIAHWLSARLLIGGGGFAVSRIVSETEIEYTVRKVVTGGFFVLHPTVNAELPLTNWMRLVFSLGYYMANVSRMESATFGFNLLFGKT